MKAFLQKLLPRLIGARLNFIQLYAPKRAGRKAFTLFCTPRKGRLNPANQEYLEQAADAEWLEVSWGKIRAYHWQREGKQTVLLLHGWESNSARWRKLIPELVKAGFHIVAIDAPAHGASDGPLFNVPRYAEAITAAFNAHRPEFIVGHSVGAASLVYFVSSRATEGLQKLVLLGAPGRLAPVLGQFQSVLGLSGQVMESMFQHFERTYELKFKDFVFGELLKDDSTPSLIIHDKKDRIAPFQDGLLFRENMPHAEWMATEGMGHSLQHKAVFDRIVKFLK